MGYLRRYLGIYLSTPAELGLGGRLQSWSVFGAESGSDFKLGMDAPSTIGRRRRRAIGKLSWTIESRDERSTGMSVRLYRYSVRYSRGLRSVRMWIMG